MSDDLLKRLEGLAANMRGALVAGAETPAEAAAEIADLRERVRSLSWMGEGYALVERRAEAAEAEVARLREAVIAYLADDKLDTGILEDALTPKGELHE